MPGLRNGRRAQTLQRAAMIHRGVEGVDLFHGDHGVSCAVGSRFRRGTASVRPSRSRARHRLVSPAVCHRLSAVADRRGARQPAAWRRNETRGQVPPPVRRGVRPAGRACWKALIAGCLCGIRRRQSVCVLGNWVAALSGGFRRNSRRSAAGRHAVPAETGSGRQAAGRRVHGDGVDVGRGTSAPGRRLLAEPEGPSAWSVPSDQVAPVLQGRPGSPCAIRRRIFAPTGCRRRSSRATARRCRPGCAA